MKEPAALIGDSGPHDNGPSYDETGFGRKRLSVCPRCKQRVLDHDSYGESGIYRSMHRLCFPCWEEESQEIDAKGTNDLPETLASYGAPNDFG